VSVRGAKPHEEAHASIGMMMKGMRLCALHKAAWVLMVVGALNWGLVGIAKMNLVEMLLGGWPMVVRVVYVLVGLSGVAMLMAGKCCMGMGGCACKDEKCDHCGMDDKKPAMGGEHKM
jgi:uncharacterized protein